MNDHPLGALDSWPAHQQTQAFSISEMESKYTHGRLIKPASCAHPVLIPVCLHHTLDTLPASRKSCKELPYILHLAGVIEECSPQVCKLAQYSSNFLRAICKFLSGFHVILL